QSTANGAIYTAPSGAIVFTAGTFYWSWKLDDNDYQRHGADPRVQRMTANILNRMIPTAPAAAPGAAAAPAVTPDQAGGSATAPTTAAVLPTSQPVSLPSSHSTDS